MKLNIEVDENYKLANIDNNGKYCIFKKSWSNELYLKCEQIDNRVIIKHYTDTFQIEIKDDEIIFDYQCLD